MWRTGSVSDPQAATLREFLYSELRFGQFVTAKGVGMRREHLTFS
jgi:hypothetical protein